MSRPALHKVTVVEVVAETADTCSLVLAEPFAYRPGQFLTVRVPHAGRGHVSRCYSLSSAPQTDERLTVTVKRVPDGYVSNWICDNVRPGSTVDILPPAGSFTPASLDEDLLLFAGGSGITPVISIVKAALAGGVGQVALIYANRDADSVIFGSELDKLVRSHPHRLRVEHWLDADAGYPTVEQLTGLVQEYAGREAFVCGPEPYMALVGKVLAGIGTPAEKVHIERFTVEEQEPAADGPGFTATAQVDFDGQVHRFVWPARKRLLDVLLDAGLNAPHSCRQGNCGACMLRILEGEVELVHNEILEEEDFAENWTLACQAIPRTEHASFTYDAPAAP
ncbi:MAG TPA: ferredoxin--NADP reductase [Micromonosporaceae bacterium]